MDSGTRQGGADKLWRVVRRTRCVEWGGGIPAQGTGDPFACPTLVYRLSKGNKELENRLVDLITGYRGKYQWSVHKHERRLGGCNYFIYPAAASDLARQHDLEINEQDMPTMESFSRLRELEQAFCRHADLDLAECAEYVERCLTEEGYIPPAARSAQ